MTPDEWISIADEMRRECEAVADALRDPSPLVVIEAGARLDRLRLRLEQRMQPHR